MGAIARRVAIGVLLVLSPAVADQAQDALGAVNRMTTALSDNDPIAAMSPFDRSFPQYDALSAFISNLTASYLITNEADVVDEQDEAGKSTLTLDWTLTLISQSTDASSQRHRKVTVTVVKKGNAWKIVTFSPVDLFDPQQQ